MNDLRAAPLLALDPGPKYTAFLTLEDGRPTSFAKVHNDAVLTLLRASTPRHVVIEMIASYGMAVGAEVFETCVWIGRFMQAAEQARHSVERIRRLDVKVAICHSVKANDSSIRAALVDRWGGKEQAVTGRRCETCKGRKIVGRGKRRAACTACSATGWAIPPGPLQGMAADVWAALALACTAFDRRQSSEVRA